MNAWILSETPVLAARLSEILAQLGVTCATQSIASFDQTGALTTGQEPPQIVFLAVSRIFPPHLEVLRRLRRMTTGKVAVLAAIPNHTAVLQAIRAGADDFIDLGGELCGEMQSLIGRIADEPARAAARKKLLTVVASADPSDANLLAANLAAAAAQRFGRCELLDFHLRGGDLATMFGLSPRHTLGDLLRQEGGVDLAMFDQATAVHASGVRLLAGPKLFNKLDGVQAAAIQKIVSLARGTGSVVVVNAPEVEQFDDLHPLALSDSVALTTRLDLVSLVRAKHHLAFLVDHGVAPAAIRVVGIGTGRRGEVPARDVQRVLGEFALECVPDDPFAQMVSINVGEPMVLRTPKSEASRAICRIAAGLFEEPTPPAAQEVGRTSLFSLARRKATPAPAVPAQLTAR